MKDIHLTQVDTSDYFNWIYWNNISFNNMPWITWAVDVDLLNKVIDNKFEKNLKICEIWCWIGTESIFLSKMWYNVTSIDLSKNILGLAKKNTNLYWVKVDFKQFDITNEINWDEFDLWDYDLVIDRACFHHILPLNRIKYLNNVSKLLKKNWTLYIRWFSDKMSPSISWDWPYRLSNNDFYDTFQNDFRDLETYYYKNLPAPNKNQKEQIWISFSCKKSI